MSTSGATSTMQMFWPLAIASIVSATLRFHGLGANSLWVDEFATLSIAAHSPADILGMSSSANFIPPLYFLLVHGVLQLFGESEAALRLLSVVAGICTIPVVWLLTEQITASRNTANIAAALLAVNPLHLWFSQEARPYALLLFFGCCALLSLQRAVRGSSVGYWIIFAVCSALAFLTHTTGVMFGLIAWIWVLWLPDRQHFLRPLVAASLAAGLICAPFVVAIARALSATHGTFHSLPRALTGLEVPYNLLTYVFGYSFGPAPREIQDFGALAALRSHPIQSAIAGGVLVVIMVLSWVNHRATMTPFITLFGIPLVGIFALSAVSGKAYNIRYTLPALVGFLGIASITLRVLQPPVRAVLLTVLICLGLWADAQWFWVSRYWKDDSRAAVVWLRNELTPGSVVAVAPAYSVDLLKYYTRKAEVQLRFLPIQDGMDSPTMTQLDALVLSRLHHVPNWRRLKADFLSSGGQIVEGQVAGYQMLVRSHHATIGLAFPKLVRLPAAPAAATHP